MDRDTTIPKGTRRRDLVGFWGHIYGPDDDYPDLLAVRYQFEIIRKMRDDRYVLQLFGWWDGDPTQLMVKTEAELLGENVKLYASAELMRSAAEKAFQRERRYRDQKDMEKVA